MLRYKLRRRQFRAGHLVGAGQQYFYITVKAQLFNQIGNTPAGLQELGLQYFVYTLVIK